MRLRLDGLNSGAALRTGEGEGRDRSLGCGEGAVWIVSAPMQINVAVAQACAFSDKEMVQVDSANAGCIIKISRMYFINILGVSDTSSLGVIQDPFSRCLKTPNTSYHSFFPP
jgi:hypothetical protein